MNEILAQIMLLARRSSDKGWGNILFIVFLAIFWVIGGILKAKKNAQEKKAGGQGLGQKPGVKPPEGTKETPKGPFQQIRAVVVAELEKQRELQTQDKQRKVVHPKPAVRKIVTRPERVKESYNLETLEEIRLPSAIAEVEPKLDKLPFMQWELNGLVLRGKYCRQGIFRRFCQIILILMSLKRLFCITRFWAGLCH